MTDPGNSSVIPRQLVTWLSCSVAGVVVFLLISTIHGLLVPGFAWWHQSVSALALAPHGWVQAANFFLLGGSILFAAPAWRRLLRGGRGATAYPVAKVALGLSLLAAGCLPQDPAPGYDPAGLALDRPTLVGLLHLAAAAVAATSSVILMFVVAARLSGDPHWRGWAFSARLCALLTIACVVVYSVWSVQPSGLAGTFERLSILIPAAWGAAFLGQLWSGRPFRQP